MKVRQNYSIGAKRAEGASSVRHIPKLGSSLFGEANAMIAFVGFRMANFIREDVSGYSLWERQTPENVI
jgi:hypothetical protein